MQAIFSPNSDKTGSANIAGLHVYEAVQRDAENAIISAGGNTTPRAQPRQ